MRECADASGDPAAYYRAFEALSSARPAGVARGDRGLRAVPRLAGRRLHDRRGGRARRRQHGGAAMSAAGILRQARPGHRLDARHRPRGGGAHPRARRRGHLARPAARARREPRCRGCRRRLRRRRRSRRSRRAAGGSPREIGEVDVLVNCAGIFEEAPIGRPARPLGRTIAVNLTAAWMLSRALLPGLRRRRGVIVNVASDAGAARLRRLRRLLRVERRAGRSDARARGRAGAGRARDRGLPRAGRDRHDAGQRGSGAGSGGRPAAWASYPMLGRVAAPAEIAEAIVFAASPGARYMTGVDHHGRRRRERREAGLARTLRDHLLCGSVPADPHALADNGARGACRNPARAASPACQSQHIPDMSAEEDHLFHHPG